MSATEIRPEVIRLWALVEPGSAAATPGSRADLYRHFLAARCSNGERLTEDEAALLATVTRAELDYAMRLFEAVTHAHAARLADMERLAELADRYWDGNPDTVLADAFKLMNPAELAETDALRAALDNEGRYLDRFGALIRELTDDSTVARGIALAVLDRPGGLR